MGSATLCMFYTEHARGVAISAVPVVVIGAAVFASVYGAWAFLREIK